MAENNNAVDVDKTDHMGNYEAIENYPTVK